MTNLIPSITRTVAPYLYGLIATVLLKRFGYVIDEKTSAEMLAAISTLVGAGVYIAIRLIAQKFPIAEKLLGSSNVPVYVTPKVAYAHDRVTRYNRGR